MNSEKNPENLDVSSDVIARDTDSCNSDRVERLIAFYRDGDEIAFDSLAEIYRPLMRSMASSCYEGLSPYYEWDDILQYALIAFSKAVMTYNIGQSKVTFGLYAKVCIGNALVSRLRSARKKHIELLPIDGALDLADPNGITDPIIDSENMAELDKLIGSSLSNFENKVFRLYVYGYSSSEIADKLGKTEKSVDNAIFRARSKLKKVLNEGQT